MSTPKSRPQEKTHPTQAAYNEQVLWEHWQQPFCLWEAIAMAEYDLIVCGAGPAGSMAAATAAAAGLKVLVLEKYPLPRHKTCGGGTPMVMQQFLRDLAPEAIVESDVTAMRHTWNFQDPHLAPINLPDSQRRLSLWMMQRSRFDHALVERAAKAGAEIRDAVVVKSVEADDVQVCVRAQPFQSGSREFTVTGRYVVGADGANGVTVKATKLRKKRAIALAMEIEFPHTWGSGHADLRPDVVHLEYGAVKHGYAWIFPKADHLNVGAGVFRASGQDPRGDRAVREMLQRVTLQYLDMMQIPYDASAIQFHAHPLPIWTGKEARQEGRIILVGDAAGLINPLFGDGILHAVKSGIIASECIIQEQVSAYSDRIHQTFAADFDAALKLATFFYQYPSLCYKVAVKHPRSARLATQLLAGELSFPVIVAKSLQRLRSAMVGSVLPWGVAGENS